MGNGQQQPKVCVYSNEYGQQQAEVGVYFPKCDEDAPDSWKSDIVTPVKSMTEDMFGTKSPYAVGMLENVEAQYFKKNNETVSLLLKQNTLLYHYDVDFDLSDLCRELRRSGLKSENKETVRIKGCMKIKIRPEFIKQSLYELGPLAAQIRIGTRTRVFSDRYVDTDRKNIKFERLGTYTGGIFDACPNSIDALVDEKDVLLVGYTSNYWIIKNSWGDEWGESGYANIKMGLETCIFDQIITTCIDDCSVVRANA